VQLRLLHTHSIARSLSILRVRVRWCVCGGACACGGACDVRSAACGR
jgi:hypothetical protein